MKACPSPEKLAYASLSEAKRAAAEFRRIRRGRNDRLSPYECAASPLHWHLAHDLPVGLRR